MFCTNILDSECRRSLWSVPQGVSSAWGRCFLCSLALSPPPHILPPPWLPKPLHYSSSRCPHSQPLTDECASRQDILLYYILLLWYPPTSSSNMLREMCHWIYMKITYELSPSLFFFSLFCEESTAWNKAVWLPEKEEDGRRSFWNVKYFNAAGVGPIEEREERREDGGGEVRKWEKWGSRGENDIKLHPSNFSVDFITYSCDGAAIRIRARVCSAAGDHTYYLSLPP